ncbi:MAG: DUF1501 domain-containing protein, partial [Planctomycetes bacterium]|nr:DUF1501 domain-containing protein [Planctomycetota bacterium]
MEVNRRNFFGRSGVRLGGLAMSILATQSMGAKSLFANGTEPLTVHPPLPGLPHFPAKAKAVIYLHMNGGPSQIDTWDYKPTLQEFYDKDLPPSVQGGQRLSTMTSGQARFPVAPSKFRFEQRGQCGMWTNVELFP